MALNTFKQILPQARKEKRSVAAFNVANLETLLSVFKAAEAAEFVGKTGVDALAISIGTIHGFYKKAPVLDIKRAAEIAANGDKFKPLDLYFKPAEQKIFDFVRAKIRSLT